ncbi:hypothetical protein KA977_03495 [Candidatus Dependentiae bacterium]|nr:hypothetical protein [Candidatus Dependentiae bacterium]
MANNKNSFIEPCFEASDEEICAITTCIAQMMEGARFKIRSLKKFHIYKWNKLAKKNSVNRNEIFNSYWR